MVNQSMSSRKRVLDCPPIKPTLKKRSTSEVSEGIEVSICRRESHASGVKSQTEFNHDSSKSAEGFRFRREFNHDSIKSAEGVRTQPEFNHDSTKITKGRKQSDSPTLCHKSGPVKEITWRGIVEVVDCGKIRMCEELIAHLSAKASPKAKEFSKKIGSKLQFKLFPRSDLYPKIFQDACPDRDDIALYFYPTNVERSRKHYSRLVKDMELKDLMLWTQIDGRELLVYPSTILTPDSQKLEDSYFMWGVFGRRKYEFDFW